MAVLERLSDSQNICKYVRPDTISIKVSTNFVSMGIVIDAFISSEFICLSTHVS